MKLPIPPRIELTHEILQLIASIDEFRGEWNVSDEIPAEELKSLRRLATIESVGSSTRIEGSKLSDGEVENLLGDLTTESFRSRDEEEVAGYASVMETVLSSWRDLPLTEGILLQLHRDLLRYSTKDERHRGAWKTLPNNVAAFDADGRQIGIVFETAEPFQTPELMRALLHWQAEAREDGLLHPLLRIGVFKVVFLAIHPFQDGNGRLSRVLTNLLLLEAGYSHAAYSSLENVIEHSKEAYYLALRRTQGPLGSEEVDWEPWLRFFLRAVRAQVSNLRFRMQALGGKVRETPPEFARRPVVVATPTIEPELPEDLSLLAGQLLFLLRARKALTMAEAVTELSTSRNTLKSKFGELVEHGYAKLYGKGRGAHYRLITR